MKTRIASFVALAVLCAASLAGSASAVPQEKSGAAVTPAATPPAGQQPAAPAASPAPPAETREFRLPPEKREKALAFSAAKYRLYFFNAAFGVVVLMAMLSFGWVARFRDVAERASKHRFLQAMIFVPLFSVVNDLLLIPSGIYSQWLSLKYEQSVQSWGSWALDWVKGEALGAVIAILLVALLYFIIRKSPTRWWFYFWLTSIPIVVFFLFLSPFLIQLFFKFEPLAKTQPALAAQIQKVTQRGGMEIPLDRMFEMKASEKMNALNANVSGFGATKRVTVFDTTIQKMSSDQILYVFGHEMGHYVLGHTRKLLIMVSTMLLVFLFLGYRGMHWAIGRWGSRWGVRGIEDYASLPVLLALVSIFSFFADPLTNSFSRAVEHEADIYGLEVTHGLVANPQETAAQAFQVLGEVNLADPEPSEFIKVWLYNHPALNERLTFVRNYDPWSKNEPRKFVQ